MLETKLKNHFSQVSKAFFETENNANFLRVEVKFKTLEEIATLSREISQWLDEQEELQENYFLDVYSSGTDQEVEIHNLEKVLNENVLVRLNQKIKEQDVYQGKLIANDPITIEWNAKGQMRKLVLNKEDIKSICLYAKVGK